MRIKRLEVDGYRHFTNQQVLLETGTTVLAGANNSGKTSIIDLLRVTLRAGSDFGVEDFSAAQRHTWSSDLLVALLDGKNSFAEAIAEENLKDNAPKIEVRLEIAYDPETDDIREFADFLMDLDLTKNAFYFAHTFAPRINKLHANLESLYETLMATVHEKGWESLPQTGEDLRTVRSLQSRLCKALYDASVIDVTFTDSNFAQRIKTDRARFLKLFNLHLVKASRPLDDTIDDKSGALSQRFVKSMKGNNAWDEVIDALPEGVINAIEKAGIGGTATEAAIKSLNETIKSISETNGQSKTDLFLDFNLSESDVLLIVARAMQARYLGEGVPLGEGSQGLGYSNLIILHLEIEAFLRAANKPENAFVVNLVVVEEPESHMHPQMQNAFIKHLFRKINDSKRFQALVTTHSSGIVRSSKIEYLRVLKVLDGNAKIIDLQKFHTENVAPKSEEDQRLFSLLYSINFADVLFADSVVMYEGDTERMYFQALIQDSPVLAKLRTRYVSYVQVGGAHAHVYLPLIVDTLKIKTVIITDVDYEKESTTSTPDEIVKLDTSNATLNYLFPQSVPIDERANENEDVRAPVLSDLFARKGNPQRVALFDERPNLAISFQSEAEGFARTLEESILSKFNGLKVWEPKSREWWSQYRKDSALDFSIPNGKSKVTIRQIVVSTSGKKTDFMYSLILKPDFHQYAPSYVFDALDWLSND